MSPEQVRRDETITLKTDEHSTLLLNIGEVKENTKKLEELVDTTKTAVYITIALSSIAIFLSLLSMALQYFKVI